MAELLSLNNKSKFLIKPIRYEQKKELWFSTEVALIENNNILEKGVISFHINDFIELINGIFLVISGKKLMIIIDPIEPYLKLLLKSEKDLYIIDIYYNKGPIFNNQSYKQLNIFTSKENLQRFITEIASELKEIDIKLELKKVKL